MPFNQLIAYWQLIIYSPSVVIRYVGKHLTQLYLSHCVEQQFIPSSHWSFSGNFWIAIAVLSLGNILFVSINRKAKRNLGLFLLHLARFSLLVSSISFRLSYLQIRLFTKIKLISHIIIFFVIVILFLLINLGELNIVLRMRRNRVGR
jgi:hypothetical protein